jgi:hypothetical protein
MWITDQVAVHGQGTDGNGFDVGGHGTPMGCERRTLRKCNAKFAQTNTFHIVGNRQGGGPEGHGLPEKIGLE